MINLQELITYELGLVKLEKYLDEYATINTIYNLPKEKFSMIQRMNIAWLQELDGKYFNDNAVNRSKNLREEGNAAYKAAGSNQDILLACRLYTDAIFAAADVKTELCLAYANRAMALLAYGYYQQAYDDCETALEFGYPKRLAHKLQARLASCALKLLNIEKLKEHINVLSEMTLNESFQKELEELQKAYDGLIEKPHQNDMTNSADIDLHRITQKIVTASTGDRSMLASADIKENELIFNEEATSFVPVGSTLICHHCAATQLIPIPCHRCNARVVYCSRKCKQSHASIHDYECTAYRWNLFEQLGITHLAFRMMVQGLMELLPYLKESKQNATNIWQSLVEPNGEYYRNDKLKYASTLQMVTHLGKMQTNDILRFALGANLLQTYLERYTGFFEIFPTSNTVQYWRHLTTALILRHIGQLICNGHVSISLIPSRRIYDSEKPYCALLMPELWKSPYHVELGQLHKISDFTEVAAMNFPYLSICNHACEQTFQTGFSGRNVSTYATKKLKTNDEITNCYTLDYRKSKRHSRRQELQQTYNFLCKCTKCESINPDCAYESFHRYRCEKSNCRKEFVPFLPDNQPLNWWNDPEDMNSENCIKCTACGEVQCFKWFLRFKELLELKNTQAARVQLYELFDKLNNWLLDYNELKLTLAYDLVSNCFAAKEGCYALADYEYTKLAEIIKYYLDGISKQTRTNSIEYVASLTFLWDIIALGKYNCSRSEMDKILQSLDIISVEYKIVFLNYFKQFLEHKLI